MEVRLTSLDRRMPLASILGDYTVHAKYNGANCKRCCPMLRQLVSPLILVWFWAACLDANSLHDAFFTPIWGLVQYSSCFCVQRQLSICEMIGQSWCFSTRWALVFRRLYCFKVSYVHVPAQSLHRFCRTKNYAFVLVLVGVLCSRLIILEYIWNKFFSQFHGKTSELI